MISSEKGVITLFHMNRWREMDSPVTFRKMCGTCPRIAPKTVECMSTGEILNFLERSKQSCTNYLPHSRHEKWIQHWQQHILVMITMMGLEKPPAL